MTDNGKLNYGSTFLLGSGFFVISLAWSLFNSYVPIFLKSYIETSAVVGFVMTLDNIAGLTLQPYFSGLSDRTWTRFGRRMPFLMIGMPLAAVALLTLPVSISLVTLLFSIVSIDLFMSLFRGPTIALMPDLTPSPLRSKANGAINFMGGVGALLAFFVGSKLYEMNKSYPFILAAVLILVVLVLLVRFIREPKQGETDEQISIVDAMREVLSDVNKSALFLLGAIFLWFVAWSGTEAFFTTYGKFGLGIPESTASFMLGFFSVSFIAFSIPSGFIAGRFGRKRTIQTGLVGMALVLASLYLIQEILVMDGLLLVGGFFWALININSYPMVVELAGPGKIGSYTGLYYFASSLAAVLSPPLYGVLMDVLGYSVMFLLSPIALLGALAFISRVDRGEARA